MKYATLITLMALLVFVGSDWYNAPVGPQIFILLALLVSGMVVLNSIVSEAKKP